MIDFIIESDKIKMTCLAIRCNIQGERNEPVDPECPIDHSGKDFNRIQSPHRKNKDQKDHASGPVRRFKEKGIYPA